MSDLGTLEERHFVPEHECDRCGACCIYLNAPVDEVDRRREPLVRAASDRLPLEVLTYAGGGRAERGYLAQGADHPCPLLGEDGGCTVYVTRPGCCERFRPGSDLCQYSRGRAGLPGLHPVRWRHRP